MIAHGEMVLRIAAGAVLGGVIGYERYYDRRLEDDKQRVEVQFDVSVPVSLGVPQVIATIEAVAGVRRVQVRRTQ